MALLRSNLGQKCDIITLDVGVTVLDGTFVQTPSLTDNVVEPDSQLRIQSIVVGRSGIVGFDFEANGSRRGRATNQLKSRKFVNLTLNG